MECMETANLGQHKPDDYIEYFVNVLKYNRQNIIYHVYVYVCEQQECHKE